MDQFGLCGLLINGAPLTKYGARALLDYSVGESTITTDTFQGINRSTWHLLKATYGVRALTMTIVFAGATRHEASMLRSKFNHALFGESEIYISDDGFFYTVTLESTGAEVFIGAGEREAQIKSEYRFKGIRHDALVRETVKGGGKILCRSTLPFTDCRLTVTVGASASSYTLGGAVFSSVTPGDVLVFDGIKCRITKNGANAAASVSWVDFPRLTPGENTISAKSTDNVLVEYYPSFL